MLSKKFRTQMIRWRLRVLMAEKNINNKTLSKQTGIHPTTISRLKNTDELKQITGEVLNALCNALGCTPNDLIEFTPDSPPEQTGSVVNFNKPLSPRKKTLLTAEESINETQSVA
ncbi:MAG: helix-turn-helix domain-containing protein [Microcystaceae cyanobacterium]